ncbi:5'-3' exonuclease, partial [Staphylococcus capitis]
KLFKAMTYAHTLNEILSICNEHKLYVSSKYIATHL